MVGGHQQDVGAVQGEREVVGCGGVHHLLRVPAADPGVLVVVGQRAGVARAQPQAGRLFPPGAEPDRLGQLDEAERLGEQGQAAAALDGLQLAGVTGEDHLGARGRGLADDVGQVGVGDHGGLVDRDQVTGPQLDGAAGAALAGQVAQELGGVVGLRDPGGQGVAGRLGRRDPDDPAQPGRGPRPARGGQDPCFPGSGGCVDHRDALAVGQDRQRGGGLVLTQPCARAPILRVLRAGRVASQRAVELRQVRAERPRGVGAVHARRAAGARERDHALFQGQLRVRGVPHAAVPLVDAAPVRAQQTARHLGRLRRLQARHRLELRPQRPVREVFQQGGGRGWVHAGPGQDAAQVLDQVRAGPGALVLLGQRDRLLRRPAHLELAEDRAGIARAARARTRVSSAAVVPHRWRDRRQAHAERARELVGPACVELREVQRAVLGVARLEVGRLREPRQFALRRLAADALLEPRGAVTQIGRDGFPAGGEQAHHLAGDALDLEAVPVVARLPGQAEPGGERFFQVLGDDRGHRADVLVVAQGVRGSPFTVDGGLGGVGDLGVDVQLHVAVAGGVLQPVRHGQVGLVPLAGFPAVHPGVVRPGAGVAGLALEVVEAGPDGLPDHLVDLGDQGRPVLVTFVVAGLAGQADVLPEGGVEDRDGLGQRNRQVEEERALPGLAGGFQAQLVTALGGGVRLGGQEPGVEVRGFPGVGGGPAQRGAVGGFALAEQQVIRFALDHLAGLQAERLGARAPPAARRLSAGLAGLEVVPGRVLDRAAVDLLPDVVQVIALAQGRDNRHRLIHRQRERRY